MYMDMDNDEKVSVGDVRLTAVSTTYEPNTKVKFSDEKDLGHDLKTADLDMIKYADLEETADGYSLGDPVYIDMDGNDEVSDGDVRLTDSPVFDSGDMTAGEAGEAWSIVTSGDTVTDDADVGWGLESIGDTPGPVGTVGFIDTDATNDWTCPDKLYFQQPVGEEFNEGSELGNEAYAHNLFTTVGDLRLYIPYNDPYSPFQGVEEWPECGTKVTTCDVDVTYALLPHDEVYDIDQLLAYSDRNDNGMFDSEDNAYIDMDASGDVTIGDVRLTDVAIKEDFYSNNTKVADEHSRELGDELHYFAGDLDDWEALEDSNRDLLNLIGDLEDNTDDINIMWFDADCSGTWTCVDGIYLQSVHDTDGYNEANEYFVTHGDDRLFIPPDLVSEGGMDEPEYNQFDADQNGVISAEELSSAIDAFYAGNISGSELSEVIDYFYLGGTGYL
jgi:hypothetical protein